MQRADGFVAQRRAQAFSEQRLVHAAFPAAGELAQAAQGLMADAAFWCGDRAQKRRVVVLIDQQAQPAAQVLDLALVEEARAPRDLVRDLGTTQRFLESAGLVVGAVEDGEVGVFASVLAQRDDARHRPLGLVFLAIRFDQGHWFAVAKIAPQLLLEQLGVDGDHVVGGAQDAAGGAVVLLQRDDLQLRVVERQTLEVFDRRAAPAVDALVVVADRREHRALAHQLLEQVVLHGVGVLVLVHQHITQGVLPFAARLGVLGQQAQRQADQVIEIDRTVGRQALLVARHHHRRDALVLVLGGTRGLLGVQAHVLPQRDRPLPALRLVGIHRAAGIAQHAEHIVAVEDGELLFQPDPRALAAQDAHAQAVKGRDHQVLGRARADQGPGALAHFLRGLVGEGDGGDVFGRVAGLQQAGDFLRDDAGLAGTGTGDHQARAIEVVDGFELGVVEGTYSFGHAAILTARPRPNPARLAAPG